MPNPPPELANYVANPYNARRGSFLALPVFVLSYTKGNTVTWGTNGVRDIPDAVSASAASQSFSRQSTVLMEDQADYDRLYSASVNAEYAGVSWSGSVESSFLYHGTMFNSASSTYALNSYAQSVLTFARNPVTTEALTKDFIEAMRALPAKVETVAEKNAYFEFFDSYGTHYTKHATMGGTIMMETDIADSVMKSSSKMEVSTAVSAGYEGVLASGKVSASAAFSNSEFLQRHRNEIQITLNVMGGLYSPDGTITEWQKSIYHTPSLLLNVPNQMRPALTTLVCISSLVEAAGVAKAIGENIEKMLPAYLTPAYFNDGLVGTPRSAQLAEVKQSTLGDGFLLGMCQEVGDGDRSYLYAANDNTPNPTALLGCASQHWYMHHDRWVAGNSMIVPVKLDSYFVARSTQTAGWPSCDLNFVGFGNKNTASFGDWKSVESGQAHLADSDGFLLASIDGSNSDGARAIVRGKLWDDGSATVVEAAASQHYYTSGDIYVPCNSFCMPVLKGMKYQTDVVITAGTPVAKASFVPLNGSVVQFGRPQVRSANTTFQAQSDGFLLAYIDAVNNGERGQVNLYACPNTADLISMGLLATASVHYYEYDDIYVPCNSAAIPVAKNSYYRANFDQTAGLPKISLMWVPFTKVHSGA